MFINLDVHGMKTNHENGKYDHNFKKMRNIFIKLWKYMNVHKYFFHIRERREDLLKVVNNFSIFKNICLKSQKYMNVSEYLFHIDGPREYFLRS